TPLQCSGPCLTGACDPQTGCVVAPTDAICNDGNPCTADRCIAASTCQNVPQNDGAPCPAGDACHAAGTCRGGACDGGPALSCSDGDFCTDDACHLTPGCRNAPVTGLRRSSCRVDTMLARLAAFPGDLGGLARKLTRRLDRAGTALSRAEAAKRPAKRRAALAKARRELHAFVVAVRHSRALVGAFERQLVADAT